MSSGNGYLQNHVWVYFIFASTAYCSRYVQRGKKHVTLIASRNLRLLNRLKADTTGQTLFVQRVCLKLSDLGNILNNLSVK